MFQDEYEISSPETEQTIRTAIETFLGSYEPKTTEHVVAASWMVDLLWGLMREVSDSRNNELRHLWYGGVTLGEFSRRTGISAGRLSRIVNK